MKKNNKIDFLETATYEQNADTILQKEWREGHTPLCPKTIQEYKFPFSTISKSYAIE